MGHIAREISCHVYYFTKTEGSFLNSSVISTKYLPSPMPFGRLEILLLLLKFSCPEQKTSEKMKNFVDSLHDYDYSVVNDEESSKVSLKLISQNQSVTQRLIRQNWSVTLTVVLKKNKISTLTLILTKQLTWPLIFCF